MRVVILIGQRVRSGTNFLGSTLSQHPEIQTIPKEISHAEFNLFRSDSIVDFYREASLKSFGNKFDKKDELNFYKKLGELWLSLLIEKFDLDSNKVLFLKTPIISHYDLWLKAFPEAKFIFLARDGRDNVVSSVKASNDKRSWHGLKIKFKKRFNYYSGRSFTAHTKDWKKTAKIYSSINDSCENIKKLKYEQLISSNEHLRQLLFFLELKVSDKIVKECSNAPVVGSSFGDTKGKISRPNWKPNFDKSKFKFTEKWEKWFWIKKLVFKLIAGEELRNLNYEIDYNW